jgi:hypothetical protein
MKTRICSAEKQIRRLEQLGIGSRRDGKSRFEAFGFFVSIGCGGLEDGDGWWAAGTLRNEEEEVI